MPRYFAPLAGFADHNITAIKIDTVDDHPTSAEILEDGSERPVGSVGWGNRWVPTWTETELATLVTGGSWRELDAAPKPATPAAAPTPPEAKQTPRRTRESQPTGTADEVRTER